MKRYCDSQKKFKETVIAIASFILKLEKVLIVGLPINILPAVF